jgi:hypothetical protein
LPGTGVRITRTHLWTCCVSLTALAFVNSATAQQTSQYALKPPTTAIQYLDNAGNDTNDGLSPGSAKLTYPAALAACPSSPSTGCKIVMDNDYDQPITQTWYVYTNPAQTHGVELDLPCTSNPISINIATGAPAIVLGDRSTLKGCSSRASVISLGPAANVSSVLSFYPNPGNRNITEYAKVEDVWFEGNSMATVVSGYMVNLANAYDSIFVNMKIGTGARGGGCLLGAPDSNASTSIAPNADDFYSLLLDGGGQAGVKLVCIQSSYSKNIGPIHFIGGDWGHPGPGQPSVLMNSPSGNGFSFGISFRDIYMETNANEASVPVFSVSNTRQFTADHLTINRLNGSSTQPGFSFSDTLGTTLGLRVSNTMVTGGSGCNGIVSTVKNAPSLAACNILDYKASGLDPNPEQ